MGDKDVSLEDIKKLMQELGGDAQAYLTMSQLQNMINQKNAAEARIQELEARLIRKDELLKEARRLAEKHKEHLHRINKLKFHGL